MVDRWISYCFYIIILLHFFIPVCSYVIFNDWLADSIPVTLLEDNYCFFFLGEISVLADILGCCLYSLQRIILFRKGKKK